MNENGNRAEAERLLGVAEKLLHSRDFNGTRDFAVLAQETEALLEGPDQILAIADVLSAAEKRVNNNPDWYAILQIERRNDDQDLLKKQYRRLALLLHPDKNKYPFADQAFKLVADAWAVLSDSAKKSSFDGQLSFFTKVDLSNSGKLPVRRRGRPPGKKQTAREPVSNISGDRNPTMKMTSFWTACPYCYILYEFPRVYEECCLRCPNCRRAFHAALVPSLPPLVPGKEAYYCCWGFFPLGFMFGGTEDGEKNTGFPNWMPPIFGSGQHNGGPSTPTPVHSVAQPARDRNGVVNASPAPSSAPARMARGGGSVQVSARNTPGFVPKKRGRPRKYPLQNV